MIVDPSPQRTLVTFLIAGCVVLGTVFAAGMALGMLASG